MAGAGVRGCGHNDAIAELLLKLQNDHIAELVTPMAIGIPSQEAKAEIEIHQVIAEAEIRKCSI